MLELHGVAALTKPGVCLVRRACNAKATTPSKFGRKHTNEFKTVIMRLSGLDMNDEGAPGLLGEAFRVLDEDHSGVLEQVCRA